MLNLVNVNNPRADLRTDGANEASESGEQGLRAKGASGTFRMEAS